MYDHDLPDSFPEWLRKEVVSTRHEVPAPRGRSHTVYEKFYTPKVFRWALNQWLERLPDDTDARALQRSLPLALADPETFFAYLTVPDAFQEVYEQELATLNEDRVELERVKRVMRSGRYRRNWWSFRHVYTGLLFVYALVATAMIR
jgi:hypothetical protein